MSANPAAGRKCTDAAASNLAGAPPAPARKKDASTAGKRASAQRSRQRPGSTKPESPIIRLACLTAAAVRKLTRSPLQPLAVSEIEELAKANQEVDALLAYRAAHPDWRKINPCRA